MPRAVRSESYCPFEVYQPLIAAGQPFHDPAADAVLFDALRRHVTVPIMELDAHINDPKFAAAAVEQLMNMIKAQSRIGDAVT